MEIPYSGAKITFMIRAVRVLRVVVGRMAIGCVLAAGPAYTAPHTLIPNAGQRDAAVIRNVNLLNKLQRKRQDLVYRFRETDPAVRDIDMRIRKVRAELARLQQPQRWAPSPERPHKGRPGLSPIQQLRRQISSLAIRRQQSLRRYRPHSPQIRLMDARLRVLASRLAKAERMEIKKGTRTKRFSVPEQYYERSSPLIPHSWEGSESRTERIAYPESSVRTLRDLRALHLESGQPNPVFLKIVDDMLITARADLARQRKGSAPVRPEPLFHLLHSNST